YEKSLGGLLHRGMVGHLRQSQRVAQLGPFAEHGLQPAVVGPEELPQGEEGEVLVLGVVVAGELRGGGRQRLPGGVQRGAGHRQGGLGHGACGLHTYTTPLTLRRFSTEQRRRRTTWGSFSWPARCSGTDASI